MKFNNSSERHFINNLKVNTNFEKFHKSTKVFKDINRVDILDFLDGKVKSSEIDFEQRWIATWNLYHYYNHLKFFFRWLYNDYIKRTSIY